MADRHKIRVDGYNNLPSHVKSFLKQVKAMGYEFEEHSLYYDETYIDDNEMKIREDQTETYLSFEIIVDAEKLARQEYPQSIRKKYPDYFDTLGKYYGIDWMHVNKKIQNEESLAKKILPEVKKFIKTLENNQLVHSVRWSKNDSGSLGEVFIVFKNNPGVWFNYNDKKKIVDESEDFLRGLGYKINFKRNF
jgi:hypothetical protein